MELEVYARVVDWGRWYRRIHLTGDFEAVVEYNRHWAGYETVLVNGSIAVRASAALVQPEYRFAISAEAGDLKARMVIRHTGLLRLDAVHLWIEDTLVYAENSGRISTGGIGTDWPIPSAPPAPSVVHLPVPDSGSTGVQNLPVVPPE